MSFIVGIGFIVFATVVMPWTAAALLNGSFLPTGGKGQS